jgi:hypothetical protein
VIVTAIAHNPERIYERAVIPSVELVYLAKKALQEYQATHLLTSLEPGWEQALAKAAIELEIPFTVILPYPGRDSEWEREARLLYLDLLARSAGVESFSEAGTVTADLECHCFQVDHADTVLALWEYDFSDEVFAVLKYALKEDAQVVNLWEDWAHLFRLRRRSAALKQPAKRAGARIY